MAEDPPNHREHPRFVVDAFVRVIQVGDAGAEKEYVFRVRDLSVAGLFLYTRVGHLYPFKVGTPLLIELYDYDQAVDFKAVIVRIVEPTSNEAERFPAGFGVKIVEIDEGNRGRLEELISRALKGEELY